MYRKESIRTPSGWVPRGRCAPSLTGAWGLGLRICPNSCRVWGGVRLCPPPLPPSVPWCPGQGREAAAAVGRSPRVLPIPHDQMPRQICPGLQTREPRPPLPGRHTRSPAWRRWRRWRGGSASREGQSAPVPASPAPPAHSDGDLVAHVLVPPPAPAAQRGPSRSSGSRQRANSARWSLAIWTAGQVVKRPPDAQPPPPAHPARAHLAALRRPEAMRPRGDALQPLDQLLCPGWEMGEEGVALADGGGDSEREALRASLFGTLPGVGGSNSSLGLAGNPHTPSPHPQERLGGWTPADTALWGRRGLCALPGFSVLLKGTQLAPKWLVDDGVEEGKKVSPETPGSAPRWQSGLCPAGSWSVGAGGLT